MNKPTKIPATAYILIGGESKRFGSLKWQTTITGIPDSVKNSLPIDGGLPFKRSKTFTFSTD
jgi:hypothetical protein